MDKRILEIVDQTRMEFGLENYSLGRYGFYKRLNSKEEQEYHLSMEWFPNDLQEHVEEDENPIGTACIEFNLQQQRYDSAIFVMQTSYSTKAPFQEKTPEEVGEWIRRMTDLEVGRELRLSEAYEDGFLFKGKIDGIRLSPDVSVEVKFNDEGQLLLFSKIGDFPLPEEVLQTEFLMTLEEIEPIVKQQLQLVTFPSESKKRFVSVYAMEEVFVKADGTGTIPFFMHERTERILNETVKWDSPLIEELQQELISKSWEVSAEEAFHPSSIEEEQQLTEEDVERCRVVACDVLRTIFPDESGSWMLGTLARSDDYLIVKCHRVGENPTFFNRKVVVIIEPGTYRMLNYMDNMEMVRLFEDYEPAGANQVAADEAFEKMVPFITLEPTYVYDPSVKKYVLCGLLDAEECVDAATGEISLLGDL
ncbi:hypothetical protein AB1K83_04050 [Sporosarcina sp. 179-K 3D1 HS]|uniref:hypothetical protein n=1 Tax=Sporosarcina sp. 179-K 3D1 HS TaxID=3232169 RepID=UPI00399FA476